MLTVNNPILNGLYPDPSICAVGKDFYLVTSTFAYFPGIPIFHSRDLKNWEQIGHVLDRPSQLPLTGCGHSEGIYAPTIRYCDGMFYVITTNVSGGGNFYVTAKDPAGPWSEPVWLGEDAPGIDPSLFFDEDSTCYYVGTRPNPEGVRYNGDWEIWVQRLDLEQGCLTGESVKIWKGAMNGVIWPEGPHIYKKDGYYYLMIAEGGTGPDHSVTVARSREIFGPYQGNPDNPILTHRHLGKNYPVTYVGHGDLAEDAAGNWYMVMLASRPQQGYTMMGRETFLAKVEWEGGWPVVNPGIGKLEEQVTLPLEERRFEPEDTVFHFWREDLPMEFVTLRNPQAEMYSLVERQGWLRLRLRPETLRDAANPSYLGVRQRHFCWQAAALLDFTAQQEEEAAGLALVQSDRCNLRFEKVRNERGTACIRIRRCENGVDQKIAAAEVPDGVCVLRIVCRGLEADLYFEQNGVKHCMAQGVDLRPLSTEIAGGFTGCTVGMYASAEGADSSSFADFGWFSYESL